MQLTIREPGSAITHFIGCLMALIAASPLLIKAHGNATYMLAMTWTCLPVFTQLWTDLPHAAFGWLLAGGIIYTIGGVIYALKLPVFNALHKYFGSHEIFHLFVMGGSVCHFIFMYHYVI